MNRYMVVKFVKKTIGNDTFFIRKYKHHWWQRWNVSLMPDGAWKRYDYISGIMYQRTSGNFNKICLHNLDALDIVRLEY